MYAFIPDYYPVSQRQDVRIPEGLVKGLSTCNTEISSPNSNYRKRKVNEIYFRVGSGCTGYSHCPLVRVSSSLDCPSPHS